MASETWPLGFTKDAFEGAVSFFLEKGIITRSDFDDLTDEAKAKAFFVSGVGQLSRLSEVWRLLDTAIREGTSIEQFKLDAVEHVARAWAGEGIDIPQRLEVIFRTNVQLAYSAGRYEQLTDEDNLELDPYWMFDAIMDDRTSAICAPCNGTVLRHDDPWWKTHQPPLHHQCRSQVVALSEEEAEAQGITPKRKRPTVDASDGFGRPPAAQEDSWVEDAFNESPYQLAEIAKAKLKGAP